mgnify:CR=1 FL=1
MQHYEGRELTMAEKRDLVERVTELVKNNVLNRDDSLGLAEYEFFSLYGGEYMELHPLRQRFEESVQAIARLIALGTRTGEFVCSDPEGTARNMMFVLEGLRAAHRTVGVSETGVDRELAFILRGIVARGGEVIVTN